MKKTRPRHIRIKPNSAKLLVKKNPKSNQIKKKKKKKTSYWEEQRKGWQQISRGKQGKWEDRRTSLKYLKEKNTIKCIKTIFSSLTFQIQATTKYGPVVCSCQPLEYCQLPQTAISYFSINIFSILFILKKSTI